MAGLRLAGTADLDDDGDLDVVVVDYSVLAWYENTDGTGTFGPKRLITTNVGTTFVDAVFADVDSDGDIDVVSASRLSRNLEIKWHENTDGKGSFGREELIARLPGARVFHADDFDGDGDIDALSVMPDGMEAKIVWYENVTLAAGDANRDFAFDQQDIVLVLQAAKFLTGEPATFQEGDWNEDGVFDQLDIVAALQDGNFLQGPYAASQG